MPAGSPSFGRFGTADGVCRFAACAGGSTDRRTPGVPADRTDRTAERLGGGCAPSRGVEPSGTVALERPERSRHLGRTGRIWYGPPRRIGNDCMACCRSVPPLPDARSGSESISGKGLPAMTEKERLDAQPDAVESARGGAMQVGGGSQHGDSTATEAVFSVRWWPAVVILAAGAGAEAFVWLRFADDGTQRIFLSMPIVSGTLFLLLLWWLFASGTAWRLRLKGLLVVLCVAAVGRWAVRIDGFEGDMTPRIRFRWQPSPEQVAARYLERLEQEDARDPSGTPQQTAAAGAAGAVAGGDVRTGRAVTSPRAGTVRPVDWPEFRGAGRAGEVHNPRIDWDWKTRPPRERWRHPVGLGWSSFAVVGDLCWTLEQRDAYEAVVCYDIATGRQVWVHRDRTRFDEPLGGPGPRSTPTFHEGVLYSLGATGILNALEADSGRLLWSRNILDDAGAKNLPWGMAGSPLVVDGMVIVNPGRGGGKAVIAYEARTGEIVWAAGDRAAAYCSPQLGRLGGQQRLLVFGGEGLQVHDPSSGRELWFFPWTNDPKINAAQPVVLPGDRIFVSCSYGVGGGCAGLKDGRLVELWRTPGVKLKFNSAVLCGDVLYGLSERILTALDTRDGRILWKRGRYGYGQMLLVQRSEDQPDAGLLLIQAESGAVLLVDVTRDGPSVRYELAALNDKTWNHPVVADRWLLLRNGVEAACYELTVRPEPAGPGDSDGATGR
ncbi:MAG: hypothetical protein D6725_17765 [Planctomycetota bacterium]|nr:MAG: hypothetical protein D6725_17765 [Planctomycetota bacterium]